MNGYESILMMVGAVAFPGYLVYAWSQQSITLRDPSGSTTTYDRHDQPRSYFLGLGIMAAGTVLCWGFLAVGAFQG